MDIKIGPRGLKAYTNPQFFRNITIPVTYSHVIFGQVSHQSGVSIDVQREIFKVHEFVHQLYNVTTHKFGRLKHKEWIKGLVKH